jgi:hypothetical protein
MIRVEIPKGLESHSGTETEEWVTLHFDRIQSWPPGSQTAYRTRMQLLVFAPGADAGRQRVLLEQAPQGLDQCGEVHWLRRAMRGEAEWREGECLYSANTLEEPSWIVSVHEPGRGVRVALRVWKKDLSLDRAREVMSQTAASFQALPGLAAKFDWIRGAPRREAEGFAGRMEALKKALAGRGFPRVQAGEAAEHDGFVYLLSDDGTGDFTMGRYLGAIAPTWPPLEESIPGDLRAGGLELRGEGGLFWFVHQEGEWRQHSLHAGYYVPTAVVRLIGGRHVERNQAYFYDFTAARLRDADGWEPAGLLKWMERARRAEREFARGEIIVPQGR